MFILCLFFDVYGLTTRDTPARDLLAHDDVLEEYWKFRAEFRNITQPNRIITLEHQSGTGGIGAQRTVYRTLYSIIESIELSTP